MLDQFVASHRLPAREGAENLGARCRHVEDVNVFKRRPVGQQHVRVEGIDRLAPDIGYDDAQGSQRVPHTTEEFQRGEMTGNGVRVEAVQDDHVIAGPGLISPRQGSASGQAWQWRSAPLSSSPPGLLEALVQVIAIRLAAAQAHSCRLQDNLLAIPQSHSWTEMHDFDIAKAACVAHFRPMQKALDKTGRGRTRADMGLVLGLFF